MDDTLVHLCDICRKGCKKDKGSYGYVQSCPNFVFDEDHVPEPVTRFISVRQLGAQAWLDSTKRHNEEMKAEYTRYKNFLDRTWADKEKEYALEGCAPEPKPVTIEQRAEELYPDNTVSAIDTWTYARSCYTHGATDQREIDISNACDIIRSMQIVITADASGRLLLDRWAMADGFRKMMEEKA